MADNSTSNTTGEHVKLVLTVLSTFGLGTILVVIVGRLWTIAYFGYFGLSAADLDFRVEDFAFRSLEVFISLGLVGLGLLLAWYWRSMLRRARFPILLLEIAAGVAAIYFMFWLVDPVLDWAPWLASTGVLGIISGIVLILMILAVADIWFGPSEDGQARRHAATDTRAGSGDDTTMRRDEQKLSTLKALIDSLRAHWRKVFAACLMVAIAFIYLPLVTEKLAVLEAEIDLEEGRLPAAFLESDRALPAGVASDADPTKSVAVRVILTSSGNTFVLNSTRCKTIAEASSFIGQSEGGDYVTDEDTDVCEVFAIPSGQLTSIEYIQVAGRAPSNTSYARPEEVSLEDPFTKSVSTMFATDQLIPCSLEAYEQGEASKVTETESTAVLSATSSSTGEDSQKYKTLWYRFEPAAPGTVKATVRVPEKNSRVNHAIGIWEEQPEGIPIPLLGSHDELACLGEWAADKRKKREREIAVIANVQHGTAYLVSLGSEKGVDATLELEFRRDAQYFSQPVEDEDSMNVLVPADRATVTVTLTVLDAETFKEGPLEEALLEDIELTLTSAATDEDGLGEPIALRPDGGNWSAADVGAGAWTLTIHRTERDQHTGSRPFIGHASVTVTNAQEIVVALNNSICVDGELQRALFLLSDAAAESFKGVRVFVDSASFAQTALVPKLEDEASTERSEQTEIEGIIEAASLPQDFDVRIHIEGDEQALRDLADHLADRISQAGLEARVLDCQEDADVCFRVFRRAPSLGATPQ